MAEIVEKVRTILTKHNLESAPVPIERVANLFSIKIVPYSKFTQQISGTIIKDENFIAIGVNSNDAVVRQRFTIAHELGHFLLGHDIAQTLDDAKLDRPIDNEKEADKFAAELLIPIDFLKKDIESGIKNLAELSRRYEVSEQAMSVRLLNTGLINKL